MKVRPMHATWPRLASAGRELWTFVRFVADRFARDQCPESAATLAYTTLLSLVPLLTVAVSVLSAFPVFDTLGDRLRDMLLSNLVPSFGATVQEYVGRFVDRAAGLTLAGGVGVLVSALLMIAAIDRALNRIWHVHKRRRPVQGFMVYWTVLTLSPVLFGASLAVSSYLLTLYPLVDLQSPGPVAAVLLRVLPFVAETGAFLFLYTAVPNRRVRIRHALLGAAGAAMLFELAKSGFAFYVKAMPAFEAIYGALATIPLFLVWLYVCWLIVLLGAECTQALSAYHGGWSGPLAAERWRLVAAVRILGQLWQAQQMGAAMGRTELVTAEPRLGDRGVQATLESLEGARVVQRTARGRWVLARDLTRFTLLDLYRQWPVPLPLDDEALNPNDPWDRAIQARLRRVGDPTQKAFGIPLSELLEDGGDAGAPGKANTGEG